MSKAKSSGIKEKRNELYDLVLIAILCALGLAIKPILNPMIHIISSFLRIPGGSLSGGFLMMWMALARVIIDKPGVALLFGVSQGITVMLLGYFGSHGVFTIISYGMPGLMVEIFALLVKYSKSLIPMCIKKNKDLDYSSQTWQTLIVLCLYTVVANITGAVMVAIFVMQVPALLMIITIISACISGLIGGYFANIILHKMKKYNII